MALNVTELASAAPTGNLVYDPDTLTWVRMTQPVVDAGEVNIAGPIEVDGVSTLVEQQTQTTHLSKIAGAIRAEDSQHSSGHDGFPVYGVRNEDNEDFSGHDGDYIPLALDAKGHLMIRLGDETLSVTGAFWQATQPVSAVSLPLPSGAATETSVAALTKPSDEQKVSLEDFETTLRVMLRAIQYPGWLDRSANQIRAQVTGAATVSGNLTTVTNLTNLGTFPGDHLQRQSNMAAWQLTVRSRIS